jgi:hypothetical protein
VRGRLIAVVLAAAAVVAWCGWVSALHRDTTAAEVTWLCSLAAVLAVDALLWRGRRGRRLGWAPDPVADPWPRPGRGGARRALRGVAPWLVLVLVALAWDVLGLDSGRHSYHLTISALSQAYRPLNALVLFVWLVCGVGYEVARVRSPTVSTRAAGSDDDADGTVAGAASGWVVLGANGHRVSAPALLLPSSPPLGVAFWVAVPLAAVCIDLLARRSEGRVATAEEFVRFISTSPAANVVLIAAWVFAGYHLFAR